MNFFLLKYGFVAVICFAVIGGGAERMAEAQRMPRGSYLQKLVKNASEIVTQLNARREVRERFQRVFHMPPQQINAAMGELRLTKLPADKVFKIYYVRPGEVLGYRLRTVKSGTLVFVMPDGTPALVKACGNPMRSDLSGATVKNTKPLEAEDTPEPVQKIETVPPPTDEFTTSHAGASLGTTTPPSSPPDLALTTFPSEDFSDFVVDREVMPLNALPTIGVGKALLSSLTKGGLIVAGLTALGNWISGGTRQSESGGGGTSPGSGVPTTPGTEPNPPVTAVRLTPEWNSGTLLLFALGGLFLGRSFLKRGLRQG